MALKTVGALLGISATLPATFDAAGYAAVTVTNIGEIVDLGGFEKTWSVISFQPLAQRYPTKLKGIFNYGDVTFTFARVAADTGQDLVRVAELSDNSYTIKITMPGTAVANFTAKVISLGLGAVTVEGVEMATVTLAIDNLSPFESGV